MNSTSLTVQTLWCSDPQSLMARTTTVLYYFSVSLKATLWSYKIAKSLLISTTYSINNCSSISEAPIWISYPFILTIFSFLLLVFKLCFFYFIFVATTFDFSSNSNFPFLILLISTISFVNNISQGHLIRPPTASVKDALELSMI